MTDLLAGYSAAGPGHDEMLQSTGAAREAWAQMADLAGLADGDELAERAREVVDLLEDNGVRFGAGRAAAPWRLDPLPVLFDEVEWARVEAGLQQRALLMDHILTDISGESALLTSGMIPPSLVLAHPGLLREVADIRNPGPHQLVMLGADIARNADGSWQVLADRAQVPMGMGYAMQDRRVVAEVLSGLYRHSRIRRVGPFFQAMRAAIHGAAPQHAEGSPRAVLLSPGPFSAAAFDQAYVATMLGYPLVEGSDLVVEDGRLWMRALGRLEPVDVVLRHIDAAFCDPLELRGSNGLGVPGLAQAAREGSVSIANPLGAGVLDNPGLLTYLPRLCREILGEELLIPSTVTYWCGERSMCSHVMANLDRLVVRSSAPGSPSLRGWELTIGQRADLSARIAAEPHLWVAQERVEASTTPTVKGTHLEARATQLRTFAAASGDGYEIMSGGVAHVADGASDLVEPGTVGTAKDVWVLSSRPFTVSDPWLTEEAGPARGRVPSSISPGAAEGLFWFGRYAERAENNARLVRAVGDRWNDFSDAARGNGGPASGGPGGPGEPAPSGTSRIQYDGAAALGALEAALAEVVGPGSLPDLVTDPDLLGSVAQSVGGLRQCATSVRDQLSGDMWATLSSLERSLEVQRRRQERQTGAVDVGPITTRLLEPLLSIAGILGEAMVRDVGWCLLDAGRRLERAQYIVETFAATLTADRDPGVDALVLESVLHAHESGITYRRRYQSRASIETLLDLMLMDDRNPRSLRFQLAKLQVALGEVPAPARGAGERDALLADVVDLLAEVDTHVLGARGADGTRSQLAEVLTAMAWRLRALGDEIARIHFTHPVPTAFLDASGTYGGGMAQLGPFGPTHQVGDEAVWSEPGLGKGES